MSTRKNKIICESYPKICRLCPFVICKCVRIILRWVQVILVICVCVRIACMECLVKCLQFCPIVRHIRPGVCIQPRVRYGHRYRYLDRQGPEMIEIEVGAAERAYKVYGCVQSCPLGVNRVSDSHINIYVQEFPFMHVTICC
jgi:hypothetical protein